LLSAGCLPIHFGICFGSEAPKFLKLRVCAQYCCTTKNPPEAIQDY
jgi:hypothetical protein